MKSKSASPFERLIDETKRALPEMARDGIRRNISDKLLLVYAVHHVLTLAHGGYTAGEIRVVLTDLLNRGDNTIHAELTALLMDLYEIRNPQPYLEDRRMQYRIRYRFEIHPEWSVLEGPHEYVVMVIASAVAAHLLKTNDWVRPSWLAPSRRKRRT